MKAWISKGAALERARAEQHSEDSRLAVTKQFAAETGQGLRTLTRSLAMLDWLRPELLRFGATLEDVPLSLNAIETLRRIAVLDRRTFNTIMPAALHGRLTFNDILTEKKRLDLLQDRKSSARTNDLDGTIAQILSYVESLEKTRALGAISDLDPQGRAIALPDRSFKADQSKIAVFYPPSWGASRTVADVLCRVFASLCFYDRSYFIFDDPHYDRLFDDARKEVPAGFSAKLITLPLTGITGSAVLRAGRRVKNTVTQM